MSDFGKLTEDLKSKFKPFKEVIEQYPNAFSLIYSEEKGYQICIDLDLVKSFWENPTIKPFKIDKSKPLKLVDDFEGLKGVPTKFWSPIEIMEKQLIPCYKRMEKEGKVPTPDIVANHLSALILSYRIQHTDHFGESDEFYDSLPDLYQK